MTSTGATTTSSVINLAKTLIGSGLLAMPLAFATDGWIGGCLMVAFAATICGFGFYLQGRVSKYVPEGRATFFLLCELICPSLAVVFDGVIAFNCFGGCLSYWVLIGDLMPSITGLGSRNLWIGLSLLVIVPLCFPRRLDALRFTSLVALAAVFYIVMVVLAHCVADVPDLRRGTITAFPPAWSGTVSTFPILLFAFSGHQNMFTLINELRDKSQRNITRVVVCSVGLACAVYITVGLAGYFTFGDNVVGNIMVMYDKTPSVTVAQIGLSVMCHLSIPLMFHPCRESVHNVYQHFRPENPALLLPVALTYGATASVSDPVGPSVKIAKLPASTALHCVSTAGLLTLGYTLSLTVSSFALVLEVIGATGCTSVALIFPGLFGWKLLAGNVPLSSGSASRRDRWLGAASLALVALGLLIMVSCLYSLAVRGEYIGRGLRLALRFWHHV